MIVSLAAPCLTTIINKATQPTHETDLPMFLSSWNMHHVSNLESHRRLSLGLDQPAALSDVKDLAFLVRVPKCPRARREGDVSTRTALCHEHDVEKDLAGRVGGQWGCGRALFVAGANKLHLFVMGAKVGI